MPKPRIGSVLCHSTQIPHQLVWHEWGEPENPDIVICAHALDRTGMDFSSLAETLSQEYRVICPDFPGRGFSDKLACAQDYNHEVYLADMQSLINTLDSETVDWVGTSLGGIIGLRYAAQHPGQVRKLVLNDVGTEVSGKVLKQAGTTMARALRVRDIDQAILLFKVMTAECGPLSDDQWHQLTKPMLRPHPDGGLTLHYDVAIAKCFLEMDEDDDLDLWPYYQSFDGPLLVIRGEQSNVLTKQNYLSMVEQKTNVFGVEIPGTGHSPMLVKRNEIAVIRAFLND